MVYVPTYNPTVVYGAWPYPGVSAVLLLSAGLRPGAAFFSFSVGVVVGGALWGNCNWGDGDVDIDVNRYNNFNRNEINTQQKHEHQQPRQQQRQVAAQFRASARAWAIATRRPSRSMVAASSQQGLQSREEFRGHADQGRQQISREGAGNQRDLSGNQIGTRDARADRSTGIWAAADSRSRRSQTRDRAARQTR